MKKKARMTGVVVMAMAFMITFCGVPAASRPVCTTPETQSVKTVVLISCRGGVTEEVKVNWESSNEDLLNSPPLQDREVIVRMDYRESVKVTNGETRFVKDMGVDTGDTPNLDVMGSVGYNQADTIGSLSLDEGVGMSIVANWCPTEGVLPCSFAIRATDNILPASSEDVSAASSMVVTDVLATTRGNIGITEAPVSLHYGVTATGSGGAGTPAHGSIAAQFSAYALEGSAENVDQYALGSRMTYYERSSARGLWEFHAEMDYTSRIELP
jgi:hypothetical protein